MHGVIELGVCASYSNGRTHESEGWNDKNVCSRARPGRYYISQTFMTLINSLTDGAKES